MPKIYSPKFAIPQIAYNLASMTDRPEMFGLTGGEGDYRAWPIQWNHVKCYGNDPCYHGNNIWPRCGDL